jgi:ATP-dependent DNA helicase RecG
MRRGDEALEVVVDATARVNSWRQAALDFTQPPVRHTVEEIPCTNARGEPDRIVLIEIESSERVHETVKGETYLRVGDETRRLGPLEAQELRYDKGYSTFEGTVAEASLVDIEGDSSIAT